MTSLIDMKKIGISIALVMSVGLTFAQSWTKLNSLPTRLTFPVVDVIDGKIHVVGGGGVNGATDLHLRYSPTTDSWDTLAPVPYLAQQPGGGVINGKLHYFGGGYPNSGTRLDDHYAYDPKTNTWSKLPNVPIKRVIHKTAVLGDSIYVLSGQPDKKRVDVFNAVTSTWTQYNDLPDNNFWYSGMTTYNGKIYRFGGGGNISASEAAHVYNPSTDAWSSLAALPKSLHAPDAAVLGDSIYITGGYTSGRYIAGTWIYDIAKDAYSQGPYLNSARSYHNMVRVGDCLYSIGGNNNSNADSTAVSVLRFCRGDEYVSVAQKRVDANLPTITISETDIHIVNESKTNTEIVLSIYNMAGIKIFEHVYSTNNQEEIIIDKSRILGSAGMYVCRAKAGRAQSWLKFVVN